MAMVVMKGHPGSGKSTLARSLGAALKWPVVDKDDIRDSTQNLQETLILQADSTTTAAAEERVKKLLNAMAYEAMWRVAETQMAMGMSVIVDSPLSRHSLLRPALAIAHRYGARLLLVECVASDTSLWRSRLESRSSTSNSSSASGSWHKPSHWEDLQALLHSYQGCWDYPFPLPDEDQEEKEAHDTDLSCSRKLVVDTTSADLPFLRDAVLRWIKTVSNETPILSFITAPSPATG